MDLSIKSIQENWKNKSTAQKVGTVAAGVAGAAAVGVTTAAAIRGGKLNKLGKYTEEGDKFVLKNADAAKDAKFTDKAKGAWNALVDGFKSIFTKDGRKAWNGVEAKDGQEAVKGQKEVFGKLKEQLKAEKAAAKVTPEAVTPETNLNADTPEVEA